MGGSGRRRGGVRHIPPAGPARRRGAEVGDHPVRRGDRRSQRHDDGDPPGGDLGDRATYYRFDLFLAANPTTPPSVNDAHSFIFTIPPFAPLPPEVRAAANAVALGAQEQIAVFFASDGLAVIDPDGAGALFEAPIVPPLPEDAVFFP